MTPKTSAPLGDGQVEEVLKTPSTQVLGLWVSGLGYLNDCWHLSREVVYMGKVGSICHFPRALLASIWGHCSQVLVFTSIWGTKTRGVTMTFFVLFFLESGHLGTPKDCKTRENVK